MASPAPGEPKPLRFKFGVALLVLYPLLFLAMGVLALIPMNGTTKAAAIGGLLVTSEVVFFVGVALIGKEAYQALKARWMKKKPAPDRV